MHSDWSKRLEQNVKQQIAECEDQHIFEILKSLECKYCGQYLYDENRIGPCCDLGMIDNIIEV